MLEQKLGWEHLNSYSREMVESLLRKGYRQLYYKLESRPSFKAREELVSNVMSKLIEKNINVAQEEVNHFLEARSLYYDDIFQRQLELEQG